MHMMLMPDMVYRYPIWAVAILVVGSAVLGAVLLELFARFAFALDRRRTHNDVAAAIFSVVGVLYAVLLAFFTTIVWDGFDAAKAASFHEAAAAAEVWQLADDVPADAGAALRASTRAYVQTVIRVEWPAQALGQPAVAGRAPLNALHRAVGAMHPATAGETNLHAALLAAVSHLEDARADRLLAVNTTMPTIAWVVMLLGAGITIAFASFLRAQSLGMHLAMQAALALSGALVVVMIIALNNPFRGDFRVSTAPFDRALAQMHADGGGS